MMERCIAGDRAVSQVLSVVLMVTITVVLSAVVATAVLGVGDQAEAAPTAEFDFSYDESADTVTIRHQRGQDVLASTLYIRGSSIASSDTGNWVDAAGGDATGSLDGRSAVVSGDSTTVSVSGEDYVVRVIWKSPETDLTAELVVDRGPGS